jgi:hypothetical protein
VAVGHIDCFIDILDQLLQAFLCQQDAIGLEEAEDIQAIAVMPNDSSKISLGFLEITITIFSRNHTDYSPVILHMILKHDID